MNKTVLAKNKEFHKPFILPIVCQIKFVTELGGKNDTFRADSDHSRR